jgi:uncharacterized protein (TIGR04255 family)
MAFPDAPRVHYELNPLDEVVCQLRFPPILRIESEVPSEFQERIRANFPYYESKPALKLPPGLPAHLAASLARELPIGQGRSTHEFTSADRYWTLSLTRQFLALTCRRYERWERFQDRLRRPLEALLELYEPPFYTRIGLRYRDVIRRSEIGLGDAGWGDLLKPWIAGPLGSQDVAAGIQHAVGEFVTRLTDPQTLARANFGLVLHPDTPETCFLIDADFFDERQTELIDAIPRLDYFNRQAGLFFRWCIQDRLHEAMRPSPLD